MNETKRMVTLFGVILVIIGLICLVAFWPEKDNTFTCDVKAFKDYEKVGELSYDKYECLKDKKSYVVAVSDKITTKDKKALNAAFKDLDNGVYTISLNDYSKEEQAEIKENLNYSDDAFSKDVLLYVKNGKIKSYKENILDDKSSIKDFLKENKLTKFMCSATVDSENENLATVDYDGFECLYESDEPFVLVVAQTTCSYCLQFKPVLNEFAKANDVVAYVANVDQFSEEELTNLTSKFDYFTNNESWGTPTTLAVKDKKDVANLSGYTDDEDSIKNLYTKIGILK
jgi:predicted bacteriocin transport accessory protein